MGVRRARACSKPRETHCQLSTDDSGHVTQQRPAQSGRSLPVPRAIATMSVECVEIVGDGEAGTPEPVVTSSAQGPGQPRPGRAETVGLDSQRLAPAADLCTARTPSAIPTIGDEFAERRARVRVRPEPKRRQNFRPARPSRGSRSPGAEGASSAPGAQPCTSMAQAFQRSPTRTSDGH